jgi:hypothetical protein
MMSDLRPGGVSRRQAARILDLGLPPLGVAVVLAAVIVGGGGWGALWMAVAGLLMVEAGTWRLGSRMLHERRYLPLREEIDRFVGLAPRLHHAAARVLTDPTPAAREALAAAIASMHASVDRMADVAGRTEQDLDGAPGPEPAQLVGVDGEP